MNGATTDENRDFNCLMGRRLRAARATLGLSLEAVAEKSGGRFPAVVVGSYERGDRALNVARLVELAALYGKHPFTLLPVDVPTDPQQAAELIAAIIAPADAPPLPFTPRHRSRAACGTYAGYHRHLRERTEVCSPCLVAMRTYQREYHRRRAERLTDSPERPALAEAAG